MSGRLVDEGLQGLPGELGIIRIDGVTRVSLGHPERARILLEGLGQGFACGLALAGHVGDQTAVIALIILRPIGTAQTVKGVTSCKQRSP